MRVCVLTYCNTCKWPPCSSPPLFCFTSLPEGLAASSEHFTVRPMKRVLASRPAGISSHGYGQCQLGGAAGLNPGYQSGHSCAEACRGAAPAVGDPARLLLCPLGKVSKSDRQCLNVFHSMYIQCVFASSTTLYKT